METNWRKVVTDPQEVKIFEALEDKRYDWRTLHALARKSNLSEDEVRKILAKYPSLVRRSKTLSKNGKELFTLQSSYFSTLSTWTFTTSGTSTSS